jgi:hypothetical protein
MVQLVNTALHTRRNNRGLRTVMGQRKMGRIAMSALVFSRSFALSLTQGVRATGVEYERHEVIVKKISPLQQVDIST